MRSSSTPAVAWSRLGFTTGYDTPHACSLWAVGRSVMFGIMASLDQKEHVSSHLPQVQLLDEVVVPVECNDICPCPAAHHSGGATGAGHHQGRHHPRRCAETGSHGLTVQQTMEILLLQYIDKVFDDLVVHSSRFLGCSRGEDGLDPTVAPCSRVQTWRRRSRSHSCNVDAGHCCSHACRYATTGAGDGRDSAGNCGGSAVGAHRLA